MPLSDHEIKKFLNILKYPVLHMVFFGYILYFVISCSSCFILATRSVFADSLKWLERIRL